MKWNQSRIKARLKHKAQKSTLSWLVSHGLLSPISYTIQDHLPMVAVLSELGPSISIINHKSGLHICLQANMKEAMLHLRILLSREF